MGTIIPNMGKMTPSNHSLIDVLFTSTQKKVLGLLFGNPDRKFFSSEIIRLADAGSGAVQRELAALSTSGLINVETQGKQKYYLANHNSPIFEELRSIIRKTVGLTEPLKQALKDTQTDIKIAFVYGSIAKGTDTATSDIDLLVVSDDLSLAELYAALSATETSLGRKINPTLYTSTEFEKRIHSKNFFIKKILESEYIILVGDKNVLEAAR